MIVLDTCAPAFLADHSLIRAKALNRPAALSATLLTRPRTMAMHDAVPMAMIR